MKLEPSLVEGTYTFHSTTGRIPAAHVQAIVVEDEGTTVVLEVAEAEKLELEHTGRFAWITLGAVTDLAAVGITAKVSGVLAEAGIACNVLAGFHHDHLLVPVDRGDEALGLIAEIELR